MGEGGAGGVAGQARHSGSDDAASAVAGENGAVAPAPRDASHVCSVEARPEGGDSGDHGSRSSIQEVAANSEMEMSESLAGA